MVVSGLQGMKNPTTSSIAAQSKLIIYQSSRATAPLIALRYQVLMNVTDRCFFGVDPRVLVEVVQVEAVGGL